MGDRLIRGMHASIATLARAGNCVLADHVLRNPSWVVDCAHLFDGLPAWLVGIRCPLYVLEERERMRRNRTLGQSRAEYNLVYAHGIYEYDVDTSLHTPEDCAMQIAQHIDTGIALRALIQLLHKTEDANRSEQC